MKKTLKEANIGSNFEEDSANYNTENRFIITESVNVYVYILETKTKKSRK